MGPSAFRLLKDTFTVLLNCADTQILDTLFIHMDKILQSFWSEENLKNQMFLEGVMTKILEIRKPFDDIPTVKWRQHERILQSFKVFPLILDSESVYEQCVPVLFKILLESYPITLKRLSCEILVLYMRRLKRSEYQEVILRQLLGRKD